MFGLIFFKLLFAKDLKKQNKKTVQSVEKNALVSII